MWGFALVVSVVLGGSVARGNEKTDSAEAFENTNPFSILLGVDYDFSAKRASI